MNVFVTGLFFAASGFATVFFSFVHSEQPGQRRIDPYKKILTRRFHPLWMNDVSMKTTVKPVGWKPTRALNLKRGEKIVLGYDDKWRRHAGVGSKAAYDYNKAVSFIDFTEKSILSRNDRFEKERILFGTKSVTQTFLI